MTHATWRLLLFGRLKEAFGNASLELPAMATTVADLRAALADAFPEMAGTLRSQSVRFAVNQKLVADEPGTAIRPSDEIALLPPLSGG